MANSLPYPIHTIADAVSQVDQGEDPWFALGCFLHDWWCYAADQRQELICVSPSPTTTLEGKRWAAFFAATVEELCLRISFPSPPWTEQQIYMLETPWFFSPKVIQHDRLLVTTPEPFRRRNIFVSESVLDNKYELHYAFGSKPKWSIWSDQDLQNLRASDGVSSQQA